MALDCRELFARVSEYLDGEIPPDVCEAIRLHVAGCERCERVLDTLRATVDLCRCLPPSPFPDDLRRRLRSLIEDVPSA